RFHVQFPNESLATGLHLLKIFLLAQAFRGGRGSLPSGREIQTEHPFCNMIGTPWKRVVSFHYNCSQEISAQRQSSAKQRYAVLRGFCDLLEGRFGRRVPGDTGICKQGELGEDKI